MVTAMANIPRPSGPRVLAMITLVINPIIISKMRVDKVLNILVKKSEDLARSIIARGLNNIRKFPSLEWGSLERFILVLFVRIGDYLIKYNQTPLRGLINAV